MEGPAWDGRQSLGPDTMFESGRRPVKLWQLKLFLKQPMIIQAMREFPLWERYPFERRLQAGDNILATSLVIMTNFALFVLDLMWLLPWRQWYKRILLIFKQSNVHGIGNDTTSKDDDDDDDDQRTCMVVHWRAAPGLADRRPQVQALQFALEIMSKIMVVVMGRMLVMVLWHW